MLRRIFIDNWILKVLSAALALILYMYVESERQVEATLMPPVIVNVPEGMINVGEAPQQLQVKVSGPWSLVATAAREEPIPAELDATGFGPGEHAFLVDEDLIRVPPGLRVISIEPKEVRIDLQRTETRRVPVRVHLVGEAAFGYRSAEPRVDPATVEIAGPRSDVRVIEEVSTEPVDISGATQTVQRQVRVALPQQHVSRVRRDPVTVTVPVIEEQRERRLENLQVMLPEGVEGVVRPGTVGLTVAGPVRLVEPLTAGGLRVEVPRDRVPPPGQRRDVPVRVILPEGVQLVGAVPQVEVERFARTNGASPG